MKVKELFARLDKDDILRASRLIFGDNIGYYEKFGRSIPELIKEDNLYDRATEKLIDAIVNVGETAPSNEDMVIFVTQLASDDFDDKCEKYFHSMGLLENEFHEKAGKDFQLWTRINGKEPIHHYCYDCYSLEVIGNYRIADQSIAEYSAEACAAVILDNITRYGYDEETRLKNIEEERLIIEGRLEKIKNMKSSEVRSLEDFEKEIQSEKFFHPKKDDDEELYNELKDRFDKDVEDIKDRWRSKVIESNHQKLIANVKAEWERMYGGKKS